MKVHLMVLGLGLCIAVISDLWRGRISDVISLGTAGAVLVARFATQGLGDFDTGVLSGVVAGFGAALVFSGFAFRQRGLDWADVKLLAAMGAGLGFPLVLAAVLFTALSGAVLAIVFSLWNGDLSATLRRVVKVETGAPPKRARMPYSVAIAVGSVWAMWWEAVSGFSSSV